MLDNSNEYKKDVQNYIKSGIFFNSMLIEYRVFPEVIISYKNWDMLFGYKIK